VLEELRIRGLGVIDDAELVFAPGLTVVTGETGAGKTMVVTALSLLMGGRSDPGLVRPGAAKTVVEGRVRVSPSSPATLRAIEAGAELDDQALLLGRMISAEGRSRAYVGGRTVPAAVLAEIGTELVVVHGQSDQRRLLRPTDQRDALDRFAGEAMHAKRTAYRASYDRLRHVETEHAAITEHARARAQEADFLRLGLAEIEAAAAEPGEDVALSAEATRLTHAEELHNAALTARLALTADEDAGLDRPDALGLVDAARRAVDTVRNHDPSLAQLADRLAESGHVLADIAADLSSYVSDVEADPARLSAIQDRRAALNRLLRKYGADISEVLAWAERARRRLLELDSDDERVLALATERRRLRTELAQRAMDLSQLRHTAAAAFCTAVARELAELAMPDADVDVRLRHTDDAAGLGIDGRTVAFGPGGVDEIEILLAPHRGAAPRPLHRGASGGELSRVMLAVEVVLAGTGPVPTFVFDEVDAGIGGAAAIEVGRRLAQLSRSAQVIVVTHLPQVAAFADRHLQVVKTDDGRVTESGVIVLDGEARVRELSRMLAGLADSPTAAAHALELLHAANTTKRITQTGSQGDAA
jgi:DNA repair protein RecN (Recombination protein N)